MHKSFHCQFLGSHIITTCRLLRLHEICYIIVFICFYRLDGVNRVVVPFLACGDLSACDSDKTYDIVTEDGAAYVSLPPTQCPINPPYQLACYLKKNNLLSKINEEKDDSYTTLSGENSGRETTKI